MSLTQNMGCAARRPDEQGMSIFSVFLLRPVRQLTTCQTAAKEFLRQFWTSIYPPPDLRTLSSNAAPRQS